MFFYLFVEAKSLNLLSGYYNNKFVKLLDLVFVETVLACPVLLISSLISANNHFVSQVTFFYLLVVVRYL